MLSSHRCHHRRHEWQYHNNDPSKASRRRQALFHLLFDITDEFVCKLGVDNSWLSCCSLHFFCILSSEFWAGFPFAVFARSFFIVEQCNKVQVFWERPAMQPTTRSVCTCSHCSWTYERTAIASLSLYNQSLLSYWDPSQWALRQKLKNHRMCVRRLTESLLLSVQ